LDNWSYQKRYHVGLVSRDDYGQPELLSFVWRDQDRRYFIASSSSLAAGQPVSRDRYRQLVKDRYTPPEKINISIPQPQACELYYDVCGKIDQHNRGRQATLGIEVKLNTHD
jgi:hypothetical protein